MYICIPYKLKHNENYRLCHEKKRYKLPVKLLMKLTAFKGSIKQGYQLIES